MKPAIAPTGQLLGVLSALLYALLALAPDSTTRVLAWPGVAVWQLTLATPLLWLALHLWQQQRIRLLGGGWDAPFGVAAIALIVSTLAAAFPEQGLWTGWAGLGGLAVPYAIAQTPNPTRWLQAVAAIGVGFAFVSLGLWTTQTWLPELARLGELEAATGADLPYRLSVLELRNWAPLGHQNYVAGFLALVLPLQAGLGWQARGWQRGLWWSGVGAGLLALFATGSRAGAIALLVAVAIAGGLLARRQLAGRWVGLGVGAIAVFALLAAASIAEGTEL